MTANVINSYRLVSGKYILHLKKKISLLVMNGKLLSSEICCFNPVMFRVSSPHNQSVIGNIVKNVISSGEFHTSKENVTCKCDMICFLMTLIYRCC